MLNKFHGINMQQQKERYTKIEIYISILLFDFFYM